MAENPNITELDSEYNPKENSAVEINGALPGEGDGVSYWTKDADGNLVPADGEPLSVEQLSNAHFASAYSGTTGKEQIQKAINAADSEAGANIVVVHGKGPDDVSGSSGAISDATLATNAWEVPSAITVPSNTVLLIRSAYLYLSDGADDNILRDSGAESGTRNSNISIIGDNAILDGNNTNQTTFDRETDDNAKYNLGLSFYKVDSLVVKGITIRATNAWGLKAEDVTNARFLNIEAQNGMGSSPNRDGVHPVGPAQNVVIDDVVGETEDDLTAVNCDDPDLGLMYGSGGDVTNVSISNVNGYTHQPTECVRAYSGPDNSYILSNVEISNVTQNNPGARCAVSIGLTYSGNNIDKNLYQNVNVSNVSAKGTVAVEIQDHCRDVSISNLNALNAPAVFRLANGQVVSNVSVSNITGAGCDAIVDIGGDASTGSTTALDTSSISGVHAESIGNYTANTTVINIANDAIVNGVDIRGVSCYLEDSNGNNTGTLLSSDSGTDANNVSISDVIARKQATVLDVNGSMTGAVSRLLVNNASTIYAATGNLAFDPSCPSFDSAPANVVGTMPVASASWDPDGDGNGEIVAGDGANWNEVADMPNI